MKFEIRNPKSEGSPNTESGTRRTEIRSVCRVSDFRFPSNFGIRISNFFRRSSPLRPPPSTLAPRPSTLRGFTLIEVALAVAIVLVGVLALFALIISGLDSSAKAVADTQSALFADNVFNGLSAASLAAAERGGGGSPTASNSQWRVFWDNFAKADPNGYITIAAPSSWSPTNITIQTTSGAAVRKVVYQMQPQHSILPQKIVNHALQYAITVKFLTPIDAPPLGLKNLDNNRAMVTMKVWDGEFTDTTLSEPLVFYSEFDNPGDL